jgi:hypothetical protein
MSDNRTRILELLDAKKISVEEATRLLEAVDRPTSDRPRAAVMTEGRTVKYLRVMVDTLHGHNGEGPGKVNIRVPVALIRAGMKFTSLLPKDTSEQIEGALKDRGFEFNLKNLKDEDLEELINALTELEVEVNNGDKIKIYAE